MESVRDDDPSPAPELAPPAIFCTESLDLSLLRVRNVFLADGTSSSASERSSPCDDPSELSDFALQMSELGLPTSFCSSSSYAKKKKSRAKHVPLLLSPLMPPGMPKEDGNGMLNGDEIITCEGSMVLAGTRYGEATDPHDDGAHREMGSAVIIDDLSDTHEDAKDSNDVSGEEAMPEERSLACITKCDKVTALHKAAIASHSALNCSNIAGSSGLSGIEAADEGIVVAAVSHDVDAEGYIPLADEETMAPIARFGEDMVLPNATVEPSLTIRNLDAAEVSSPETAPGEEIVEILYPLDEGTSSTLPGNGLLIQEAGGQNEDSSKEMVINEISMVSFSRDGVPIVSHNAMAASNPSVMPVNAVEISKCSSHEASVIAMVSNNEELISECSVRRMMLETSGNRCRGADSLVPSQMETAIFAEETSEENYSRNGLGIDQESLISTTIVVPEVNVNPLPDVANEEAKLASENTCREYVSSSHGTSAEGEANPMPLWVPYWDDYYSRYYFYNRETLETTWEPPESFGDHSFEDAPGDCSISQEVPRCCSTESVVLDIIDEIIESVVMRHQKKPYALQMELQNQCTAGIDEVSGVSNIGDEMLEFEAVNKGISPPKLVAMSSQMDVKNEHTADIHKESVVSNIGDEMLEFVAVNKGISQPKPAKMSRRQRARALRMELENQYAVDNDKESLVSNIIDEKLELVVVNKGTSEESKHAKMSKRKKKGSGIHTNFVDPFTVDMGEHSLRVFKYWVQRYRLFSKYDSGVKLDEEGWFSVTPETIAKHQASRCDKGVIVDAFTGVGGNAIQFALAGHHVIAIDNDPRRIEYAHHNAMVYGVADRIDFIVGDFFAVSSSLQADIIFLSPPWGGPEYLNVKIYDIETMLQPRGGSSLFRVARAIAPNVILYLPRNVGVSQLAALSFASTPACVCEVERVFLNGKLKAVTAYYGRFLCVEAGQSLHAS